MVQRAKACLGTLLAAIALLPTRGQDLTADLASDDECNAGEVGCSLSALQLRGKAVVEEVPAEEVVDDIPVRVFKYTGTGSGAWKNGTGHAASAPDADLAHVCNNGGYCLMDSYLVVAGRSSAVGMESISRGNVGYYNTLMYAARAQCGSASCVLITNPANKRTQNRFHIDYRHYDGAGARLKHLLERAVCGRGGWHRGDFPCNGEARYFGGFPSVFSAAIGAGSIAQAAISVWPSSCHGGTIVLVSRRCGMERSISAR